MTAQTIEVEGLPEGYKVIDAHVTSSIKGTNSNGTTQVFASITVEKIQPRRIVLEEDINDNRNPSIAQTIKLSSGRIMHIFCPYAVREVNETDTVKMGVSQGDADEPKLSLSVDECKEAMRKLETFNVTDLSVKICTFLKESS